MLRGHLDAITSTGYAEGWAFDGAAPLRALGVAVRAAGREVANGVANLYRWDLADAGYATGWCAFRLRLTGDPTALATEPLSLWDVGSQTELHQADAVAVREGADAAPASLDRVRATDPTLVQAIDQLRGCGRALAEFIDVAGIEEFVRRAFLYVLERPADPAGLALYSGRLREEALKPYDILKALADSEEFGSAPRLLAAPPEPGFPFRGP